MIAAILAGGLGTRLRPMISDRPKVLAEVRGRPFLAYILDQIADAGIRKVVICSGYRGDAIPRVFGSRFRNVEILYSREHQPLGTAGALRQAMSLLDSDPFLVLNGDSYCDVEVERFEQWHRTRHASASVVLATVEDVSRFGKVHLSLDGRILRFSEKGGQGKGWINAGMYLLPIECLRGVPDGVPTSLERDCFPGWIGNNFCGFAHGGRFLDIGTPESYRTADEFFSSWSIRNEKSSNNSYGNRNGKTRYVILDRDGTLNIERDYLSDPNQLELLPGVVDGLRLLQGRGFGIIVVTNQSGVGRGYFSEERLEQIHERLLNLLSTQGIRLDRIYYCPHQPAERCGCRKPEPGLVWRAVAELGFDPHDAFVVGDKPCDIEMGRRVRATTLLVCTGYGAQFAGEAACHPDFVAQTLVEAANLIVDSSPGAAHQPA